MKKTHARFYFAVALCALLCLCFLFGCKPTDGTPDDSTVVTTAPETEAPAVELDIISGGATDYVFVYPSKMSNSAYDEVLDFYTDISLAFDCLGSFKLSADNVESTSAHEILVGNTSRPETAKAMEGLGEYSWIITVVDEKLVIAGGNEIATSEAMKFFTENYVKGKTSLTVMSDICDKYISAPVVIAASPEDYYHDLDSTKPEIKIDFYAYPAVDLSKSVLKVGDVDYTGSAKWGDGSVVLSGVEFVPGAYKLELTIFDTAGGTAEYTHHFGCGNTPDVMSLYKGELHAHTSDSDGVGTPRDAYIYARDVAGLDFFAVTDHSNSCTSATYLKKHLEVADELYQPGKYVTMYGYEQTYNITSGYYGHLNTINSRKAYSTRTSHNLRQYYEAMAKAEDCIVQFNHPGYKWGNFLEYEMWSELYDSVVNLYEFKGSGYDTEWALCLAKGWHVSPMHNEDNHSATWGTANEAVGYVLAPALTRDNLVDAMNLNRTYTTTDGSLKIYYSINGEWLGSRLDDPEKLNVKAELSTSKSGGLGNVYLVAEDNVVVASVSLGTKKSYTWELTLEPEYDYYYIKVSNSECFAVTAPVWVENRDLISITDMSQSLQVNRAGSEDYGVTAKVKNTSDKTLNDVTVKFYRSTLAGFDISKAQPIATVNLGTMAPGAEMDASCLSIYDKSYCRITAVVSAKNGSAVYSDTKYTMLSCITVTEIMPNTSSYGYLELYNNSDAELNLQNVAMRFYAKAGADSASLTENTWRFNGKVKAHSVAVIWFRSNANLTVADFNKKYGTSLVEGENLFILDTTKQIKTDVTSQYEVTYGGTVVSRIWFNWGEDSGEVKSGKSVTYSYQKLYTLTETKLSATSEPTPGTVATEQIPAVVNN